MKEFKIRASACGEIMGIKGLGKTGETYLQTWLKEQLFNRRKEFSNKYTQKGLIMEDNSIDMVADYLDLGMLMKNEQYFENDFFTGTPDVILKDFIIDVKNSWDCFTFPFFDKEVPNKGYYWQAQVYMDLVGRDSYKLIYVLSDTPENIIEKTAYYWCKDNGYEELDLDIYDKFLAKMTYPDIPIEKKIKVFDIQRNDADIEKIKERVKECRTYINQLI